MSTVETIKIPRAKTPEEVGVSSEAVLALIRDLNTGEVEEHGFMIIRHGKVAVESFKAPYSSDKPHVLYSVSKAVTATAIGFAVEENLLSLDARILELLPEFRLKKQNEKLEKVTVRHLMTMQAGKMPSLLVNKTKDKWLNHFFDGKWIFNPGEGFEYVNENIFLLCAILVRVTGVSVTDYLTPRLWEPLGINTPYWETDPGGVESGGWGLFLSAESLAKFCLCYLQHGRFEGRQVIPEEWTKDAVRNHKPVINGELRGDKDGYGYCFWSNDGERKNYRAEGIFSQLGIVFEDKDAIFITLGGEMDAGKTHRYIFDNFPRGFIEEDPGAPPNKELQAAIAKRKIAPLPKMPRSATENEIEGKKIRFRLNKIINIAGFPMSVLLLASTYMTKDRAGNINDVVFHFLQDECTMNWTEGDEKNTVRCGMDGQFLQAPIRLASTDYNAYSCATWIDKSTIEVWIIPIESIGKRMLKFHFNGKSVRMIPSTQPSLSVMLDSLSGGVSDVVKNKALAFLTRKGIEVVKKLIEPVHKGRIQ